MAVESSGSFSDLFNKLCDRLSATGNIKSTSKKFAKLTSDEDRVCFALKQPEVIDIIDPKPKIDVKNPLLSEQFRNKGNEYFKTKRYFHAIEWYSKSVMYASNYRQSENNTNNLALGFANRSAALFHLAKYTECIVDIEHALENQYPQSMLYKLHERHGKCLLSLGDPECARQCFSRALTNLSKSDLDEKKKSTLQKNFETCLAGCCENTINEDQQKYSSTFTMPDFGCENNKTFPSLTSAVNVVYSPNRGRYIVANEYISPGKVILIENPFASVLITNHCLTHCHHCQKRTVTSVPCEVCTSVAFCSKECRSEAMRAYHW